MTSSRILDFLHKQWLFIWTLFRYSLSYKVLSKSYRAISNAWLNSAIVSVFCRDKSDNGSKSLIFKIFYLPFAFLGLFAGKIGANVTTWWKSTLLYKLLSCMVANLIAINTRFLGIMMFCGGAVYMLSDRNFVDIIPLCATAVGAFLCLFDFSILIALKHSIIDRFLKTFLGIDAAFDYFDKEQLEDKRRLIVAAAVGILGGFAAAFFSPVIAAAAIGAIVILFNLWFGIGLTIFVIPFIPTMAATGLSLLCFLSLIIKKSGKGDKHWKLDALGALIILFLFVLFICSITSSAWLSSLNIFMLYAAFVGFYFTIINTVKTKEQLYSLILVFVLSGFFVAAYGIIQYVFGLDMDKQIWVDTAMFTDIKMRAFSTLDNPNVLGEYLLLVIPMALAFMWRKKELWTKVAFAAILITLATCMILTMSRGCWIALLLAIAIYITFVDGRYWLLGIIMLFALPMLLPQSVMNRFLSIGNLEDTSSSYRLFIWLGTIALLQDFWFVGIGLGSGAYNTIYPRYSYADIAAPHSHNVYLQIITESGIAGLIAFIAVCIFFFKNIAVTAKKTVFKSLDRAMIVAIASGIAAFLMQGMFDYVFYNYRVLLMFWIVLGLGNCFRYIISVPKPSASGHIDSVEKGVITSND